MNNVKKGFYCSLITIAFWLIARIAPGFVPGIDSIPKLFLTALMLPVGWWVACLISKGRFSSCIRVNLYLSGILEGIGLFLILYHVCESLSFRTGQFSIDALGIAYSDYPVTFGVPILYGIIYITACYFLGKYTPSIPSAPAVKTDTHMKQKNLDALYYALLGVIAALVIAIIVVAIVLL